MFIDGTGAVVVCSWLSVSPLRPGSALSWVDEHPRMQQLRTPFFDHNRNVTNLRSSVTYLPDLRPISLRSKNPAEVQLTLSDIHPYRLGEINRRIRHPLCAGGPNSMKG